MDCTHAQEMVSAALDGDPVDAAELEAAKDHCRDCTECVRFVHGLAVMKRVGPPMPPPDLSDRIIGAVAADVDLRAAASAEPAADELAVSTGTAVDAVPLDDVAASPATDAGASAPATSGASVTSFADWIRSRNATTLVAWAGAAAVVLVFAGWAAIAGVRTILVPPTASDVTEMREFGTAQIPEAGDGADAVEGESPSDKAAAPQAAEDSAAAERAQYVTIDGAVFQLAGSSGVSTATLQPAGSTTTSLDGDEPPRSRTVYRKRTGEMVYLADDAGGLLAFSPATRTYKSITYQLQSGPIASFGVWPTLPSGIEPPAASDGSPTFTPAGQDGDVTVYRLSGGSAAEGIAIGPGSPATDPAAGNPNWTWWVPVR